MSDLPPHPLPATPVPDPDAAVPTFGLPRRAMLGGALFVGAGLAFGATPARAATRQVALTLWDRIPHWSRGQLSGCRIDDRAGLVMDTPLTGFGYRDPHTNTTRTYDRGEWVSQVITAGFSFTELIPSINAITPSGTWVDISVRVQTAARWTRWFVIGRWTSGDGANDIKRTSLNGQVDGNVRINTDTLVATGGERLLGYQLRVRLFRLSGTSGAPRVALASAMISHIPQASSVPVSGAGGARGTVLAVPTYSQEMHKGHYPQYNGGGEAWCSPTSTAMILDYWQKGPKASELGWVTVAGENRPQVDHAARNTYDHAYRGTGNWAFNTAYAGKQLLRSYVTRLTSLQQAEAFIAKGIPLVVSVSFQSSQLSGAGYSTNGHLLVIVGFTASGDVVCNDPASHLRRSDAEVRVTYRRGQFENVWQTSSGGVTYIMAPWGRALPSKQPNWQ